MKRIERLLRAVLNSLGYRSDAQIQSSMGKIFEATGMDPVEFAAKAAARVTDLDTSGEAAITKADKDTETLYKFVDTRKTTIRGQRDAGYADLDESARIQTALGNLGIQLIPLADEALLDE
jgi:hypothetical protein